MRWCECNIVENLLCIFFFFGFTDTPFSVVIEGLMFVSHGIWWLRTRRLREAARRANATFDDFPEAIEWQSQGVDWTPETLWANMKVHFGSDKSR